MKYIEVNQNESEQLMQDIYKYMPTFVTVDGVMVRVVAQSNGMVYYIKE